MDITVDMFVNKIYEVLSKYSNILFVNELDLLELDMSDFTTDTYFISDMNIERGKAILIQDEQLKKDLYEFCTKNKDRVFRGTKSIK